LQFVALKLFGQLVTVQDGSPILSEEIWPREKAGLVSSVLQLINAGGIMNPSAGLILQDLRVIVSLQISATHYFVGSFDIFHRLLLAMKKLLMYLNSLLSLTFSFIR
jgi:hypothetical protein